MKRVLLHGVLTTALLTGCTSVTELLMPGTASREVPVQTVEDRSPPSKPAPGEPPVQTVEDHSPPSRPAPGEPPLQTVEDRSPPSKPAPGEPPLQTVEVHSPPSRPAPGEPPLQTIDDRAPLPKKSAPIGLLTVSASQPPPVRQASQSQPEAIPTMPAPANSKRGPTSTGTHPPRLPEPNVLPVIPLVQPPSQPTSAVPRETLFKLPVQDRPPPRPKAENMPWPPMLKNQVEPRVDRTATPRVPITLDAVFNLAQDQNGQVAIAREKLNEAFACKCLTDKNWMPDLYLGTSYYRHDGGIQDFNGHLVQSHYGSIFLGGELQSKIDLRDMVYAKVDAERKVWQQRAEVSKLSYENLLDAAGTYVDLMAARSGEAIGLELEKKLKRLLDLAQKRALVDKGTQVEASRVHAELWSQLQINRKMRESANAASARLNYLLGLDPNSELVILDREMVAFDLVDARAPAEAFVQRALSSGPGIREISGMLGLIEDARAKAQGPAQFLPTLQVGIAEGAFGAGNNSTTFANRVDYAFQARWNLTDLFTSKDRQAMADSKYMQAQLGYQDLQAKLVMGVHEARGGILSGHDEIYMCKSALWHALESYRLSSLRFTDVKGTSATEVLLSIKSLTGAQYDLLKAIREYDKAQLRLFLITGMVDSQFEQHHNPHVESLPPIMQNGRSEDGAARLDSGRVVPRR
jgi:outer membrane protein TolC